MKEGVRQACLLGDIRPRQWPPTEIIKYHKQINQRHSGYPTARDLPISRRGAFFHDDGAGNLTRRHECRTRDEDFPAPDALGDEEYETGTCDELNGTEDGGEQKIARGVVPDQKFEILRREVCKSGRTSSLLRHEDQDGGGDADEVVAFDEFCDRRTY